MWKFRKFGTSNKPKVQFGTSVVEIVLTVTTTVWVGSLTTAETNALERIVNTASTSAGHSLPSLYSLYKVHIQHKVLNIVTDDSHSAAALCEEMPSERRFQTRCLKLKCFKRSTFPEGIPLDW